MAVARETVMSSELKNHLVDKLKDSKTDGKIKCRAQMGRAGSGPEFRVNFGSGRVGSFHLWVGSRESDPVQLWVNPNRNPDNDLRKSYFDLLTTGPVVWPRWLKLTCMAINITEPTKPPRRGCATQRMVKRDQTRCLQGFIQTP